MKTPFWQLSTRSRNCWCYIIIVTATCSINSNCRERGDPLEYISVYMIATSSYISSYHYWAILSLLPHPNTQCDNPLYPFTTYIQSKTLYVLENSKEFVGSARPWSKYMDTYIIAKKKV